MVMKIGLSIFMLGYSIFLSFFETIRFTNICRKFNEATYLSAKFSFVLHGSFKWSISFPSWLNGKASLLYCEFCSLLMQVFHFYHKKTKRKEKKRNVEQHLSQQQFLRSCQPYPKYTGSAGYSSSFFFFCL